MFFTRTKRKRKVYLLLLTILIVFISLFASHGRKQRQIPIKTDYQTVSNNKTMNYDTILIKHIYQCGHNEISENKLPFEVTEENLNKLYVIYPQLSEVNNTGENLQGIVYEQVKCDKHYLIKLEGNTLKMFCQKYPDIPEKEFKIELVGYYENEIEILKSGLEFESKNDALEFVEDLQS